MSITPSIMQISNVVKAHPRTVFKVYWFRGPDLVALESNLDPSCSPKAFPTQDSPKIIQKRDSECDQFRFEVGRERIFRTYVNTSALCFLHDEDHACIMLRLSSEYTIRKC